MSQHRKKRSPQRSRSRKTEERVDVRAVEAKTENHQYYIDSILDNEITICTGPAGSGKSYISAGIFARMLQQGEVDQIIATRPLVCAGKDIGSLPGEMHEKIAPYLKPIEENIRSFLGQANYGNHLNNGRIRYEPLEVMRGATFNRSCMILDEAQNCTLEQLKMFITRMGKDSKIVINGDVKQSDIGGQNGLSILTNKLRTVEGVGVCTLSYEDIQRNGIIGRVLRALENGDFY